MKKLNFLSVFVSVLISLVLTSCNNDEFLNVADSHSNLYQEVCQDLNGVKTYSFSYATGDKSTFTTVVYINNAVSQAEYYFQTTAGKFYGFTIAGDKVSPLETFSPKGQKLEQFSMDFEVLAEQVVFYNGRLRITLNIHENASIDDTFGDL